MIFIKPIVIGLYKFFHIKLEPYYKIVTSIYDHHKFYIEACVGCLGKCTYCVHRYARGRLKSRSIENIVSEFRYGLRKGYKRFVLLGDDLGFYGHDINTDIITLLEEILKEEGDYELQLYYLEPINLSKQLQRLKKVLRSNKIIDVNIPLQTGSNRLCKLMNRDYDIKEVIQCVSEIRREFPSLSVRTQIMVGFPGETDEDFQKTVDIFDYFDEVGIFEYSDRPNTLSYKMTNKVPPEIKRARYKTLKRKYRYNLYFRMLTNMKLINYK